MRFVIGFVAAVVGLAASPRTYEELFRDAASAAARSDYGSAIAAYQAALKLRPGAPEALSNLGVVYHQSGRYREAVETMSRVASASPDLFPARLILGLDLVRLERSTDALPHLLAARKLAPDNAEAALGLAAAYVGLNRLPDAAEVYEQLTRSSPRDAEAWYGMGICYERMAEAASRRLSHAPGGASLDKQFLTEFLLDRGQVRLAEETMREAAALETGPPSDEALQAYAEARRLATKSRDAFSSMVRIAPGAWQTRLFIADLARQQRQYDEAIAGYKAVEQVIPSSPGPKLGLATIYWELGQFDEAERYLKAVLEISPGNAQALFELGNIRVRQHRDEEAIPLLETFLAKEPDSLSAFSDLGRANFHLGRNREAVLWLGKARAIDEKGDIHYQLATALDRLGRSAEAAEARSVSKGLRARQLARQERLHAAGPAGFAK